MKTYTLKYVVESIDDLQMYGLVLTYGEFPFSIKTECILTDIYGEITTDSKQLDNNFKDFLDTGLIQHLVLEMKDCKPTVDIIEIVEQLNYYFRYDALSLDCD